MYYGTSFEWIPGLAPQSTYARISENKGSPIKGQVKGKNTSPLQKSYPFLLGHNARISTASF
jgi:hypothetical protein